MSRISAARRHQARPDLTINKVSGLALGFKDNDHIPGEDYRKEIAELLCAITDQLAQLNDRISEVDSSLSTATRIQKIRDEKLEQRVKNLEQHSQDLSHLETLVERFSQKMDKWERINAGEHWWWPFGKKQQEVAMYREESKYEPSERKSSSASHGKKKGKTSEANDDETQQLKKELDECRSRFEAVIELLEALLRMIPDQDGEGQSLLYKKLQRPYVVELEKITKPLHGKSPDAALYQRVIDTIINLPYQDTVFRICNIAVDDLQNPALAESLSSEIREGVEELMKELMDYFKLYFIAPEPGDLYNSIQHSSDHIPKGAGSEIVVASLIKRGFRTDNEVLQRAAVNLRTQ